MFDWSQIAKYRTSKSFPAKYPAELANYYSPQDGPGIHALITDLIAGAQHSVVINMFGFDDDDANKALLKVAANPKVYFQMSLDSSQASGVHEKKILADWGSDKVGSSIAIGQSAKHAISHLKVMIIDGQYVVTGSTNWSLSGEEQQDNQLTLINDAIVAAEYRSILDINHDVMLKQMAAKAKAA